MESLAPWLLLVVAALVAACVVLYCHLRQVESLAQARETLFLDDLEELRGQLAETQGRLERVESQVATGPEPGWHARALQMARHGLTPPEIARELEVSVAEVQLVLAFPLRLPGE